MPFDGTSVRDHPSNILRTLGITPIDQDVLDAHKKSEITKHPASFFYYHRVLFGELSSLCAVAVLASAVVLGWCLWDGNMHLIEASMAWLAVILSVTTKLAMMTIKEPARWNETAYRKAFLPPMPAAISQLAFEVAQDSPRAIFIVGVLVQNSIVLDPYLLVILPGSPVKHCLAIWDGDKVINIAQKD
jgi:hypothetical protein